MRWKVVLDLAQLRIEADDLIVCDMSAHAVSSLKNIACLIAQSSFRNHVSNGCGLSVWSRGWKLFDTRMKLVVKDVRRQLGIAVVLIDHVRQRNLVREHNV